MTRFTRKALHHKYADEVWKELDYRAAFYPGLPISLGEYGRMDGHHFDRIDTLPSLGVDFEAKIDVTQDRFLYQSAGDAELKTTLDGEVVAGIPGLSTADAGVGVEFKKAHAVVLDAAGVTVQAMTGLENVCEQIEGLDPGVWEPDFVFVTEVLVADSCTILVSADKGAHVSLRAKAGTPAAGLRLSNAAAEFAIASSDGLATKIVTQSGMTPLFRVASTKEAGRDGAHRQLKFLHS